MSDVLFDTGKYTLKPGAREKLSKVAGILIAYPGLNIAVGGYTDNVGTDQLNQGLSEQRAGAVRDYLVQQGVSTNSITAKGLAIRCRWPPTITPPDGRRIGGLNSSYPVSPSGPM